MSHDAAAGAYVLAVDGGSQSTKVSVVDLDGVVHAACRRPLRTYALGPGGRAVHPDDDLWESLAATCRDALAAFVASGGDPSQIAAVGLCGIRSCRALLDDDGRLVEPVLSWMDTRIGAPVADLDPRVATLCSAGGYLARRLTGERRDSAAAYDGLWPIDLATRDWSATSQAYAASGMRRALLPDLVDPGGLLGHVTDEAAAATGLPVGLGVHATGNDKAVEALGCGLGPDPEDRTVLLSLGTYVAAMTVGRPAPDAESADEESAEEDRYWVNASAVPGVVLHESGGVRRGMWTTTWWRRLLAEAAVAAGADARDAEERLLGWLETGAAEVAPGSDGLVALPDWLPPAGEPWRHGAMLGFGGEHGPHHVHRAVLEGLVLRMRGHVEAMEAALAATGAGPRPLLVSGGGSRSDLTMQIVADALGRPATRPAEPDAAGTGSAICAAVGSGLHAGWAEAVTAMVRRGDTFEPGPGAASAYDRLAAAYADLPDLTEAALRRLDPGR